MKSVLACDICWRVLISWSVSLLPQSLIHASCFFVTRRFFFFSKEPAGAEQKPNVFVYLTYSTYADACNARDTMHGKYFGDSGMKVEAQLVGADELIQRKKKEQFTQ